MASRDDVLNDFAVEDEMSPAILKAYLQRYPEYTQDLLALFNELSMSDLETAEASLPLETKAISAETMRVQHVRQSLFGSGVKEFARDVGLPRGFFTGLNAEVVHLASMPKGLLKALAKSLDVHFQDVISGMQQGDSQAVAMKSDVKPGAVPPIEFEDYVDSAGLTETEQRTLQKLIAADGSD
ncbi:MAG: hypothetical protein V2I43_07580 [Parvularcula sp.]|jgi:hypothetical protein|nr:hypothetical protein [Parvularcula sp.]